MYYLNAFSITSLTCAIYLAALGSFVSLKRKTEINLSFFLLTFSAAIWQLFTYLTITARNSVSAELYTKFSYIGVTLIPITMFHFVVNFIGIEKLKKYVHLAYFVGIFVFIPLSFSNVFLSGAYNFPWGFWFKAAKFHPLYVLSYSSLFFTCLSLLFVGFRSTTGTKKVQILYMLLALLISYGGAIDYLADYGFNVPPLGAIPVIVCLTLIAYAIVTTRLMDIEVVIKKGFIYSTLAASVVAVYSFSLFALQTVFQGFGINAWAAVIITALAIVVGYRPLELILIEFTDRWFFKKKYEYRATLKDMSKTISTLMPLGMFIKLLTRNIVRVIRLNGGAGIILDKKTGKYIIMAAVRNLKNSIGQIFDPGDIIIRNLQGKEYVLREEANEETRAAMTKLNVWLIIPSSYEGEINGILLLGEKLSQDAYSEEDIDLLTTLSPHTGEAIENCRRYGKEKERADVAEEKVEIAQKEIERTNRLASLGTLTANLAHEIRNPMAILRSRASDLKSEIDNKQYLLEYGDLSIKYIDRILDIVNSMLRFAKAKEGGLPGEISNIDVNEVLEDTLTLASGSIKDKNIEFVKEFKASKPVLGNSYSLSQAFLNIILNGIDFTPPNGILTVRTREEESNIIVDIIDTGAGIPLDKQEHIFDPFFTTRAEGVGLGLSIAYNTIRGHGGNIQVESQVGRGATFSVSLPIPEPSQG